MADAYSVQASLVTQLSDSVLLFSLLGSIAGVQQG